MQKLVYVSNGRDYTEQGDINENKYFNRINALLEEGWEISSITTNTELLGQGWKICNEAEGIKNKLRPEQRETFAALVMLEKSYEQK